MSVANGLLIRTLDSDPTLTEGLKNGVYTLWGGVVRVAKGQTNAGSIVAHLKLPSDAQQASKALEGMQQAIGSLGSNVDLLQGSMNALQQLQAANLVLSGLNLAVSAAGFAIVCSKLNGISATLATHSAQLDQLVEMAVEARQRNEYRDIARFKATIETARQFAEMNDVEHLKPLVKDFREQYEFTKLLLNNSAAKAASDSFLTSFDCLNAMHERLMYLGLFQAFVHQKIGAPKYAVATLQHLQTDWLDINKNAVLSISANREWIETLTEDSADRIVSLLDYRARVAPSIEYQANILEFVSERPQWEFALREESDQILVLAA